jgi:hypothetical protein
MFQGNIPFFLRHYIILMYCLANLQNNTINWQRLHSNLCQLLLIHRILAVARLAFLPGIATGIQRVPTSNRTNRFILSLSLSLSLSHWTILLFVRNNPQNLTLFSAHCVWSPNRESKCISQELSIFLRIPVDPFEARQRATTVWTRKHIGNTT